MLIRISEEKKLIEIRNLTVEEKEKYILNGISLKWKNGLRYGIYGNESTETTALLDRLAGASSILDGTVLINGFDLQTEPLKARKFIGYLPQNFAIYKNMTPVEYLLYIADIKGMGYEKAIRAVSTLLDETGVSPRRDCLIKNLSAFEQKCIGIAQTTLGKSDILIFDDPFNGLSPREIQKVQALLEFLSQNATLIVSARDRSLVAPICDRIFSLSGGKLNEEENLPEKGEEEKEDQ